MRLCVRDLKNIYVSYFITEKDGKKYFSKPQLVKGIVNNKSGSALNTEYGKEIRYSSTIVFEENEFTTPINVHSRIWLDRKPTDNLNYNNLVVYKSNVQDNLFTIYVDTIDVDTSEIWFEMDGTILPFKMSYNREKKVGIVPYDTFIPFDIHNMFWEDEPFDIRDTTNAIQLVDIIKKKDCIILQFE